MNCRFLTCLLFIACLVSFKSYAQQSVSFDHIGIEKGLSQSSVISIAQDANGFMWLGTRMGLNRYDGYRFKIYQHTEKDSLSLSNNYITSLFCDKKAKLWVGTASGLSIYHPETDNFSPVLSSGRNSLTDNTINCITEDRKGNIWIGTLTGIYVFKNGNPTAFFRLLNGGAHRPASNIKSITEDYQGNIWVGSTGGLFVLSPKNKNFAIRSYLNTGKDGDISENYITAVLEDPLHRIWVGTQKNGLNLFHAATHSFSLYAHSDNNLHSLVNNTIRSMEFDDLGRMWIGTLNGISIMNLKTQQFINTQYEPGNKNSLSQNSVYKLYKDHNGSMWAGTYFGGVSVNYPYHTTFNIYQRNNTQNSINNNVISSFAEDKNKNIWIGTEGGGLNYLDFKTQQYKAFLSNGTNRAPGSNLIKKIFYDSNGKLWVGTHSGGLSCYDNHTGTFKHYEPGKPKAGDVPDEIASIAEDQQGRLWIATQRNGIKISNREKTTFHDFKIPDYLPKSAKIKHIMIDREIYFGTTYGLFILNQDQNQLYSIKDIKSHERINFYVNCLLKSKSGEIYIGTFSDGMIKYSPEKNLLIRYSKKSGLPNDNVSSMLEDDRGNIWIGTANGLSMFNPKDNNFKNYTVSDGLPGNEFNINAFFKKSDGEMLFGGYNGYIGFYPDMIQTNSHAGKMMFTDLIIDNRSIKIKGEDLLLDKNIFHTEKLVLGNDQNTFTLDFALLNFIKPEKNQYMYKLEGFEKKWNRSSNPSATYTNLPPGNYRFLVKGINNDGIYSQNTLQMKVTIKPPFYLKWWAYLFYTVLATGIVVLIIRYLFVRAILTREKEINAYKLDFFTNISHEIRTPLTLILGPLEKLIEETRDQWKWNKELQPIKNNADRLMKLVTELLDFRKAESGKMQLEVSPGNIVLFAREIFLAFRYLAEEKKNDYSFECDTDDIKLYFDQKQLEKVLYNLLSNAFKFGCEKGRVILSISSTSDQIHISVANDGKGIPADIQPNLFSNFYQANPALNIGTGIGLSFSKTIVELHHGTIEFESTPETVEKNGFTKFTVNLKKGKSFFKATELVEDDRAYEAFSGYSFSSLPLKNAESDTAAVRGNGKDRAGVLLIEDNQDIRFFIKSSLIADYDVYTCENGFEGWEYAIEQIPDIIISDVMMPVMDGLTLCKKLKTDERTNHIPVILLTARSAYVHQIGGLETGADIYITKPFNIKVLKLNIQNLLTAREKIKNKFSNVMVLEPTNTIVKKPDEDFLHNLISIIEDNISEPEFDVPQLASKIGMSQPVLYKKLRALTSLSVNDLIKSIRLKRAAQLLEQKAGNVSEIGYLVGFNDRKYFSSEFKKAFGVNPRDYQGNEQKKMPFDD